MTDILQHNGYYAEVHFSTEDEVFFGKLIGISDLVNFEADSVQGLKEAFIEAIKDYLETCAELNKEPHKPYKGSFNIRISPDLHRQAATFAALKKVTLNDFVKQAIDAAIEKEKVAV
jgi:predicted HicB family RNase H-like nuclease